MGSNKVRRYRAICTPRICRAGHTTPVPHCALRTPHRDTFVFKGQITLIECVLSHSQLVYLKREDTALRVPDTGKVRL